MDNLETILRHAYDAFNRRDFDGASAIMHPQVEWSNGMEGGFLIGRDEVRRYWLRQGEVMTAHVAPLDFTMIDENRVAVTVAMKLNDIEGHLMMDQKLVHIYTIENDLVTKMEIKQSL